MASVISSSLRKLGLMRLTDVEDLRTEHVDADQRQVADPLFRLFDQPDDLAVAQLRDAEHLRVRHLGQQNLRRRVAPGSNSSHEARDAFVRAGCRRGTSRTDRWPMNASLILTACARPRGASCSM